MALTPTSSRHAEVYPLEPLDQVPQNEQHAHKRHSSQTSVLAPEETPREPVPVRAGSQELSLRNQLAASNASADSVTTIVTVSSADHAAAQTQLEQLETYLGALFAPYKDGENDAAIDALAHQRALRMRERGDTPETMDAAFSFADIVDASAHDASGASNAIGFMLANITGHHVPQFVSGAAQQGAVSGIVTYVLLHLGSNINATMTAHPSWGAPDSATMDPDIAAALERKAPGTMQNFKEVGATFQAFPLTFLATGLVTAAIGAAGAEHAETAKAVIGPITSLGGGAIVAQLGRSVDLHHHRIGHALILASDNWESHLDTLKQRDYREAGMNGYRQLSTDVRSKFVEGVKKAAKDAILPSTIAKAAVWTGGLAASSWISAQVSATMAERGFSDEEILTVQQVLFATILSPITFAWTSLMTLGPLLDDKARQMLSALTSSRPQLPEG